MFSLKQLFKKKKEHDIHLYNGVNFSSIKERCFINPDMIIQVHKKEICLKIISVLVYAVRE